jgi:hypothetical protein
MMQNEKEKKNQRLAGPWQAGKAPKLGRRAQRIPEGKLATSFGLRQWIVICADGFAVRLVVCQLDGALPFRLLFLHSASARPHWTKANYDAKSSPANPTITLPSARAPRLDWLRPETAHGLAARGALGGLHFCMNNGFFSATQPSNCLSSRGDFRREAGEGYAVFLGGDPNSRQSSPLGLDFILPAVPYCMYVAMCLDNPKKLRRHAALGCWTGVENLEY